MAAQRSIVICGGAFAGLALALAFRQGLGPDIPVVVADPARSGLGKEGIAAVVGTGAPLCVLVSCDPAALGRDAAGPVVKKFIARLFDEPRRGGKFLGQLRRGIHAGGRPAREGEAGAVADADLQILRGREFAVQACRRRRS